MPKNGEAFSSKILELIRETQNGNSILKVFTEI